MIEMKLLLFTFCFAEAERSPHTMKHFFAVGDLLK